MVFNAKFFKSRTGKSKYDVISVNVDEYGLKHLKAGQPLRIAFFTDEKENLEWYERDCMVLNIGLNIDLNKSEEIWNNKISKDGVIDKGYLKTSILEIRDNLIKIFTKELESVGMNVIDKPINDKNLITLDEEISSVEFIGKKISAKILKISESSLLALARKKLIPGDMELGIGWRFNKKQIEDIYDNPPGFLNRIWYNQSVRKK